MTELGPQAKALLDAADGCDEPTLDDRTRVRAAIAARVVAGVAASATLTTAKVATAAGGGTGAGAAGAAATASLGVAAKAIVSITLVSAVSVAAATYVRRDAPRTAPIASVGAPHAPLTAPVLRSSPSREQVAATNSPPPVSSPGEAPVASPRHAVALAAAASAPSARTAPDVTDVEAEVLLLGEAHSALRSGDSSRALTLLEEHARRYPAGALGEERDATRIAALCALGRIAEAHTAADRFLGAFPSSPHTARVRASCGGRSAAPF